MIINRQGSCMISETAFDKNTIYSVQGVTNENLFSSPVAFLSGHIF